VRGPENSLERNYHYSIENYLIFITERTSNTSVNFVNFFEKHDKPWMHGRVRSMNLLFDRSLLRRDMSHITVTDKSSFVRKNYNMDGLHLNSRGKKRLMQLISERVVGGHASGISSIPVITHARASRLLA
jgi:hypothetical protein